MLKILKKFYPEYADAVEKLYASGFDPFVIVALIIQYGPKLLDALQQIIDALKPVAAVQTRACHDGDCDEGCPFDRLDKALLEAVCAAHCARKCHEKSE